MSFLKTLWGLFFRLFPCPATRFSCRQTRQLPNPSSRPVACPRYLPQRLLGRFSPEWRLSVEDDGCRRRPDAQDDDHSLGLQPC